MRLSLWVMRLLQKKDNRASRHPQVSIIVPFFNVEAYLAECIESILGQTLRDIEVILVDDGSTDGSPELAAKFATRDKRVVLKSQANAGPGAARNLGVRHARGNYLSFVDSDDRLPKNALELLFAAARRNNADVVVGAISRFNSTRQWVPQWVKGVHSESRERTSLEEIPELLRNNYPVGKVYDHKFWRKQGLAFRQRVIYEDQPLIAQMLNRARTITVLREVTYDYRAREDRSSISQRPEEIEDLRDRVLAWQLSLNTLRSEASEEVLAGWYRTVYGTHLHWYLNSDSVSQLEYWETLRASFMALRQHEPANALSSVSAEKRVALMLLHAGEQEALIAFRSAGGYELGKFRGDLVPSGVKHRLPVPVPCEAVLPSDVLITSSSQLSLPQRLIRGGWIEDGDRRGLRLAGYACVPFVDFEPAKETVEIFATNSVSGETLHAHTSRSDDAALVPVLANGVADYSGSGYVAEFDIDALRSRSDSSGVWQLFVRVSTSGFAITEPLRNLSSKGGLTEASALMVDERRSVRLAGHPNRFVGAALIVDASAVVVESVQLLDRTLTLTFRATGARVVAVDLDAEGLGTKVSAPVSSTATGAYEAVIIVPELTVGSREIGDTFVSWTVRARDAKGTRSPLVWAQGRLNLVPVGSGSLRANGSAAGNLKLEEYSRGCIFVTHVESRRPRELRIVGRVLTLAGWDTPALISGSPAITVKTAETARGEISATLAFGDAPRTKGPERVFPVVACATDQSGRQCPVPVVLGQSVLLGMPIAIDGANIMAERAKGRSLSIRLADDAGVGEI